MWYHFRVPPKIRDLVRALEAAGFRSRGGKGGHRNFRHPLGVNITLSGKPVDDAKHYQVRDVARAVQLVSDD